MPRSREEEAGVLYLEGSRAARAGGDDLHLLAGHLVVMISGTPEHKGALWPVRLVPPDNREIRLDRFIDYLLKQPREGLNLPSLYFLKRVLEVSPRYSKDALKLVRAELAKEHVDLDAVAGREHETELLKRELQDTGKPKKTHSKGNKLLPLSKGNTERQAARLAQRRPDLAEQVRAGTMKLSAALTVAGIRKPMSLKSLLKLIAKRTEPERREIWLKLNEEFAV